MLIGWESVLKKGEWKRVDSMESREVGQRPRRMRGDITAVRHPRRVPVAGLALTRVAPFGARPAPSTGRSPISILVGLVDVVAFALIGCGASSNPSALQEQATETPSPESTSETSESQSISFPCGAVVPSELDPSYPRGREGGQSLGRYTQGVRFRHRRAWLSAGAGQREGCWLAGQSGPFLSLGAA